MLNLRLRQAKAAFNDGRLDEAYRLTRDCTFERTRPGQTFLARLAAGFVWRGRVHLDAGRLAQALADAEKAHGLAGETPEVAALRAEASGRAVEQRCVAAMDLHRAATARQHLAHGRLTLAGRVLGVPAGGEDLPLHNDLEHQRMMDADIAERMERHLKADQVVAALRLGIEARREDTAGSAATASLDKAVKRGVADARAALVAGRLDRAHRLVRLLHLAAAEEPGVQELRDAVSLCRRARARIDRGRYREAATVLRRLDALLDGAKWVGQTIESVLAAADQAETLAAGPLGLIVPKGPERAQDRGAAGVEDPPVELPGIGSRNRQSVPPATSAGESAGLPERLLLRVDGVGSYLVTGAARVTVGPISSSRRPTVGLMADPALPIVTIERVEGDYFLTADAPVKVNDRPVARALLTDGDKIAMSPRCRLRFRRPNAASGSAILESAGARLPQADVRAVVLMDRELLIGPGKRSHLRADELDKPVVLQRCAAGLACSAAWPVLGGDGPVPDGAALPIGKPVRVGPIGLVVETG